MTADDLRTRAREAAERRFFDDETGTWCVAPDEAFVAGALWHASTLPTRYQIAEVLWNRANRWDPAMMPFNHLSSVECEYWMKDADAVLALFDGAGS